MTRCDQPGQQHGQQAQHGSQQRQQPGQSDSDQSGGGCTHGLTWETRRGRAENSSQEQERDEQGQFTGS